MDLTPSKLASTASRVWDESTSHFHKTDINIDLGLHGLSNTKNGKENSSEKASSSSSRISSGYVFGSRLFERSAQKVKFIILDFTIYFYRRNQQVQHLVSQILLKLRLMFLPFFDVLGKRIMRMEQIWFFLILLNN